MTTPPKDQIVPDQTIEDEPPEFNSVIDDNHIETAGASPGISKGGAVMLSAIAMLGGGVIGAGAPTLLGIGKNDTLSVKQSISELQAASAENSALAGDLSALDRRISEQLSKSESKHNANANDNAENIAALRKEISAVKSAQTDIDAVNERLQTVDENLKLLASAAAAELGGNSDPEQGSAFLDRLNAAESAVQLTEDLQMRLAQAETEITQLKQMPENQAQTSNLGTHSAERIPDGAKESLVPTANIAMLDKPDQLTALIDTFPSDALHEAIKAQQMRKAERKPSWLQRTLSKHVQVRDTDTTDPKQLVIEANAAVKNGDISTALIALARLDPPVKAAAADWILAARKAEKQRK